MATKKKQPRAPRSTSASKKTADPVTEYALKVGAGTIIAGPHVRAACERHLRDLEQGAARGIRWDLPDALYAIEFFREVLRLSGGQWEGQPYSLLDWQQFVVGSLFGWKNEDDTRRFRVAYIETAKGSGKSPMAAGIGLFGLVADKEPRAEIYSAATKKDQAMVLFRDAVSMVDQSPELAENLTKSGVGENVWNLAYRETGGWFRPISADDGQSGPRPHISLLDEVHEHRTGYMINILRAGQKSRRHPMMVMITNSGYDRQSVCFEHHQYGIQVCEGKSENDTYFAYICSLDEKEDPFTDEKCWIKANPSLPFGLPGYKYLRDQVAEARGMPSKEDIVRRLNFCEWVGSASSWISREVWEATQQVGFDRALLRGRKCTGALDLSSTTDLTALALLYEPVPEDPYVRLVLYFWIPDKGLAERAKRDRVEALPSWVKKGWIEATPGAVVDKLAVARRCAEIASESDLTALAFDRWRIEDFKKACEDEGLTLPLVPFGQGFRDMAPAVEEAERLMVGGELRHDENPAMNWNMGCAVLDSDPAGNRKITKERSTGRVDGAVAFVMAAGQRLKANAGEGEKEYQFVFL